MLITICFGFMMLIASLVEFAHCLNADAANAQCPLGEFRCDQLVLLPQHWAAALIARNRGVCLRFYCVRSSVGESNGFLKRLSNCCARFHHVAYGRLSEVYRTTG